MPFVVMVSNGMNPDQSQVGLFGGSFDPPHLGHVALVQAGLDMGLDEVWVIPACPVHRELSGFADGGVRLMWLQKIFAGQKRVKVLDWEVSRQEPTPAVDTLRRFSAEYPAITPCLMLGADAWAGLESWREYPAHRALCNVAVFARQGLDKQAVLNHKGWQKMDPEQLPECVKPGHWSFVAVELPDVSGTLIRECAGQGRSLTGLVPAAVCADIEKNYTVMKESM